MQLMAYKVLRGRHHTYYDDLESFFYILLWMCACSSWTKPDLSRGQPSFKETLLRKWEIGSFKDIARIKAGDMAVDGLEAIMEEFPSMFQAIKPLCLKIHSLLFGDSARLNLEPLRESQIRLTWR